MNVLTWITLLLFAAAALCRSPRASCPAAWWLATGVQRDGSFACWSPAAPQCANARPGRLSDECHARYSEPVHVDSQIYCTGGSKPIVVDGETVGCQRGGW